MTQANLKRWFWILGFFLLSIGAIGWGDRLIFGHRHANYGSVVTWGLWVAAYIYFIGLSAGSFLISSLVYVFNFHQFERIGRLAIFTAVVTLLMALLSIVADLGHMTRAWHVMLFANFKSPMAWMIYLYSAYFVVLLTELWLLHRTDFVKGQNEPGAKGKLYRFLSFGEKPHATEAEAQERHAAARRWVKILATAGVPLAICFHGGVGALFGVVAARPHWHSGLFPILFILSALVSGGAILTVIAATFKDGWDKNREIVLTLGKLVLALFLVDLLFQASELLVGFYGAIPGHIAGMKLMLNGPFWWVFWIGQLLLGTLVPLWLLIKHGSDAQKVTLAAFLMAVGFFAMRLNIVIPGMAVEEIEGLGRAFASHRMTVLYMPSVMEWLVTAGVVGLGLVLFGLGEVFLPHEQQHTPANEEVSHV
jgi:molybdopterin-containing oxidoreductase family membrane subunit